jgi:hypothetical protein
MECIIICCSGLDQFRGYLAGAAIHFRCGTFLNGPKYALIRLISFYHRLEELYGGLCPP